MIGSVHLEDASCPMGCPRGDEAVLTGHDLLHELPGEFTVVKCCTCGLMRTNPRPTPDTIGFYYPDIYGPYIGTRVHEATSQPQKISRIKKLLKPIFKRFFKFNTEIVPPLPPGRLLEVGCASGAFLHRMAGQEWQVEGIEFSEKAAQAAAALGYQVHAGPLETAPEPKMQYDLIVGWMVLEHLHDPISGLKKLREWSKPGAWLVLNIPNAGSLEFRLFRDRWYALQLPTHLYHFTPETLKKALKAGGWRLETIYHQRVLSNLIGSAGNVLRDNGYAKLGQKLINFPEWACKWHFALYPIAWFISLFGQTGRMTVWAQKNGVDK